MSIEAVLDAARDLGRVSLQLAHRVPYSAPVIAYVQRSYQNDPFRTLLEVAVIIWAAVYALRPNRRAADKDKLSAREMDALIAEWTPEPLVPAQTALRAADALPETPRQSFVLWRPRQTAAPSAPVITGMHGLRVRLTTGERLQFWSSADVLGVQNSASVVADAIGAVRTYGVGACGPSGFYGTIDVHLELERQIAATLGTEEAIVYAQGFMAVASVIPAFAKRGDILVVDDEACFAVQTGVEISRSHVHTYRHGDMSDLERVLQAIDEDRKRRRLPLTRRFIVCEGISARTGALAPLPALLALKDKYRYRLIVDESLSLGAIGMRGHGLTEHWGVPASRIDIIAGSFSNALGSSGGFCAGSSFVVDHQRLSSQAYCFSAALPAMFARAASHTLRRMDTEAALFASLRRNVAVFDAIVRSAVGTADSSTHKTADDDRALGTSMQHAELAGARHVGGFASAPNLASSDVLPGGASRFVMLGDPATPLRMVRLARRLQDSSAEDAVVDAILVALRSRGYLAVRAQYVAERERSVPPASIKISISGGFSDGETADFARALVVVLASVEIPAS